MQLVSLSLAGKNNDVPPSHVEVENFRDSDAHLAATRDDDGNNMSDGYGKNRGSGLRTERLFNMRANMTNRMKTKRRGRSGADDDEEGGGGGRRRSGSGGRRSSGMAQRNPSLNKFPDGGFGSRQRSSSPEGRRKGRLMVNYDKFASNPFRRNAGGDVEEIVVATRGNDGSDGGDGYRSDRSRGGSSHGGRSRRSNRSGRSGKSGRSGRSGRSSRSGLSREFKAHPWILPPHLRLAPRFDAWFALAVTSAAAVASVSQIELASKRAGSKFDAWDNYALSTCAISLIFGLFVATGTRYAPMRTVLTKNLFPLGPCRLSDVKLTLELVALTVLSIMWAVAMPIIVSGNAHYTAGRDIPLAMAGTDIWNANLYYSSWASFLLCAYLWVEVFTLSDRRGTLKVDSSSHAGNTFTKRWMLLFLNSVILISASIDVYNSPSCEGDLLKQTPYCTRALLGVLIGGVLQILMTLGVAALYRLRNMSPGQARRGRGNYSSPPGSSMLSARRLNSGSGLMALLSLIVQGVNAGLLTSPTGGGPGNVSGTLYFGSWLGLALAFEMCLRYLELCSTRSASANINLMRSCGRSVNEETTVFEDDDDDDHDASAEESQMMLDMGPVEVEDVTDEDEDCMDEVQTQQSEGEALNAKSFVFPFNADPPKPGQQRQQQRGKQVEPEEVRSASRSRSRGSRGSRGSKSSRGSGRKKKRVSALSDAIGSIQSIDVRASPLPLSGDEASQAACGNDPDGAAAIRTSSQCYGKFNDPDGAEDSSKGLGANRGSSSKPGLEPVQQGNQRSQSRESLFSVPDRAYSGRKPKQFSVPDPKPSCRGSFSGPGMEPVQQGNQRRQPRDSPFFVTDPKPCAFSGRKPKHRSGNAEPDCPIMSHTSYYSDQVEKLDEIPSTTKKRSPPKQGSKSQPEPGPTTAQISELANTLKGQRENENPTLIRQSTATNLSPLEEGSGEEISPNTGGSNTNASNNSGDENGPLTVDGDESENESPQQQQQQREVGANLRMMQAMRGTGAPPPPVQQADRSKKSSSSKMSSASASGKSKSSRSRSKEKKGGMSGLSPAGGMAANSNGRGYGSGNGGAQMSKQSGKSSQSRKTNMSSIASTRSSVILTDHSEQEGYGVSGSSSTRRQQRFNQLGSKKSKSTRSKRSASTISSPWVSTASAILTDDEESGSNPPPTISDGMSTKDDLSGFSALSSSKKSGSNNNNNNNNRNNNWAASSGPPPPPFRRSIAQTQSDYGDSASQYSSQAPVRSIHTHKGSNGDDTIVSDPTLDAGLDQSPQGPNPMASRTSPQRANAAMVPPPPRQKKTAAAGRGLHDSSSTNSATNSYDKKYSDETDMRNSSSCDENPLSHEGGGSNKVVDNIVAAALAYAEKTHGESDPVHTGFNNTQPQQTRPSKSTSMPHPPPAKKKKQQAQQQQYSLRHRASSNTGGSSSIHSFFTESQADGNVSQGGGDPSPFSSAPSSAAEDLVARALSHAQGQLVQDRQGAAAPAGPPSQDMEGTRPEHSSQYSSQYSSRGNDSGKSMGSMYSEEDTEYSKGQGVGMHYDC